ncbi:Distal membrane-arm assembly complex protein 2, partial [Pseudolycoriella hygida]
ASQPMVQQVMFNYIKGGRYEKVEADRYEEKVELTEHQKKIEAAKQKLRWRTPYIEQESFWKSKLSMFTSEKADRTSMDIIEMVQAIDFSWKGMKERKERRRVKFAASLQQFIPQRHDILGNDLGAAHFLCFRHGSVKFTNSDKWFTGDERTKEFDFPNLYDESYKLEEIRCDNMELYYEGLENIRRLTCLKKLSFRNVKTFDDWCLDRVSGSDFPVLEVLDLSGTSITERGLCALYRLPSLKVLIIDDPKKSTSYELHCMLLEDLIPLLKIVSSTPPLDDTHKIEK